MPAKRLEVVIAGDAKGAAEAFAQTEKSAGSLGDKIKSAGGVAAAGLGAITAGVIGAGVGLFQVGDNFDAAFDKIRVGTGATGEQLEALKDDFRGVAENVPASFDDVSTALTELNQRLGITGAPLDNLSTQMLNLSRITGTDLHTNIQDMTRLFGDWSVATADQSKVMDEMYRASQATGVGINELAQQVVQFGAPLRGLGFGFEESVAMLGKWQKEGVNVENVMGAMKKAYGQFSKEFGQKAPEEFRKFIEQVSKAPSASAAAALAIEKLGVRNGPDFAAAVKEGKFAYSDLVDRIKNGTDDINTAAGDTEDFAEKWQKFTNKLQIMVEPLATGVFGALGAALDGLSPYFDAFDEWMSDTIPTAMAKVQAKWEQWQPALEGAASAIGGALSTAFDGVRGAIDWLSKPENDEALKGVAATVGVVLAGAFVTLGISATEAAIGVLAATWPLLALAAAIGGLVFVVLKAYENFEWFRTAVAAVKDAALRFWNDALVPLADWLRTTWVNDVWPKVLTVVDQVRAVWPKVEQAILSAYNTALKPIVDFILANLDTFKQLGIVLAVVAGIVGAVLVAASLAAIGTLAVFAGIIGVVIVATVALFVAFMKLVQIVWDVFNNVRNALGGVIDWFENVIQVGWDLFNNVRDATGRAQGAILGIPVAAAQMAYGVAVKINEAIAWFQGLPWRILGALGDLGGLLLNAGRDIIGGLMRGITDRFDDLRRLLGNVTQFISDHKGPLDVDRALLVPAGRAIMGGLMEGIRVEVPSLRAELGGVTAEVPTMVSSSSTLAPSAGSARHETHYHFHVEGAAVYDQASLGRVAAGALQAFKDRGGRLPVAG